MRSPVAGRISRGFSWYHTALDIVNSYRTPIVAPEAGVVSYVGQMGSGTANAGNVVQIGNPAGNGHRLCHLDSFIVRVGQSVREGQVVGYMGYTGFTIPTGIGGTHLHWIMFRAGKRVNPLNYAPAPPVQPNKMPPIGSRIQLLPVDARTVYKTGTQTPAGVIRVTDNSFIYIVRGYDSKYPNRILINSKSVAGGSGSLALYFTNGVRVPKWSQL